METSNHERQKYIKKRKRKGKIVSWYISCLVWFGAIIVKRDVRINNNTRARYIWNKMDGYSFRLWKLVVDWWSLVQKGISIHMLKKWIILNAKDWIDQVCEIKIY